MVKEKDDDFFCEMVMNGKNLFWCVDDSFGCDYGIYDCVYVVDV